MGLKRIAKDLSEEIEGWLDNMDPKNKVHMVYIKAAKLYMKRKKRHEHKRND